MTSNYSQTDLVPAPTPMNGVVKRDDLQSAAAKEGPGRVDRTSPKNGKSARLSPPSADVYQGFAGQIVNALEPETEADPVALLVTLLAAVGNIVGRGPHWKAGEKVHYVRIFPVLVGETSSSRKGTAWSAVRLVLAAALENDLRSPSWMKHNIASGLSSGEGLIWAVRDPITKHEPIKENKVVVDYQNVIVDQGVEDKRLFVVEEEFASVLKMMSRDGNVLSPLIRQAWDDGNLRTMTKNSPAQATDAHITIYGHVTPHELRRYLTVTEAGNGFANRFLWVLVHRSKYLPQGGSLDPASLQQLGEQLAHVLEQAGTIDLIERDKEANDLWDKNYKRLSDGLPGMAGAITSRGAPQVMRIASIYAVLDCSRRVTSEHLRAALDLWDYCAASVMHIFGDALGDPLADTILRALGQQGELTRTEISGLFNRNQPATHIQQALDLLESAGLACWEARETEGRSQEVWRPR